MKRPTIETFELNGRRLNVSVRSSKRARKTINIQFKTKEDLVITLPIGKSVDIESLLKRNRRSLSKKYEAYLLKQRILQDNTLLYQGKPYHIKIIRSKTPSKIPVVLKDRSILIHTVKGKHPASPLKQWLIEQARKLVRDVIEEHSDSFDKNPDRVFVRDTSRWGYCKKNGEVVYNWQIMALPPRLAEYIILHEIIHLSEFNHQKGFYSRLGKIITDYKQRQQDLKRYSLVDSIFEIEGDAMTRTSGS